MKDFLLLVVSAAIAGTILAYALNASTENVSTRCGTIAGASYCATVRVTDETRQAFEKLRSDWAEIGN